MRSIATRASAGAGLALAAVLVAAGCQKAKEGGPQSAAPTTTNAADGEVVATYGGKTLTRGELMKQFESLNPRQRTFLATPDRKRQFVENTSCSRRGGRPATTATRTSSARSRT